MYKQGSSINLQYFSSNNILNILQKFKKKQQYYSYDNLRFVFFFKKHYKTSLTLGFKNQ